MFSALPLAKLGSRCQFLPVPFVGLSDWGCCFCAAQRPSWEGKILAGVHLLGWPAFVHTWRPHIAVPLINHGRMSEWAHEGARIREKVILLESGEMKLTSQEWQHAPQGTLSEEMGCVSFCGPAGCWRSQREERLKWKEALVWSREHLHIWQFNLFGKWGDLVLIQVSAQAHFKGFSVIFISITRTGPWPVLFTEGSKHPTGGWHTGEAQ